MTSDVLVSMKGLQFTNDARQEEVEVITPGNYYFRNGKHFVMYEEIVEGYSERTSNLIKVNKDILEITKKGSYNVNMVFEKNKKHLSYYNTPYGNLAIGIIATNLNVEESMENISVNVDYALEVNDEFLSDCTVIMNIKSKDVKNFTL